MENRQVVFNRAVMMELTKKDRYLTFIFKDLVKRGNTEKDALNVSFNTNVIGDSVFEIEYLKIYNSQKNL